MRFLDSSDELHTHVGDANDVSLDSGNSDRDELDPERMSPDRSVYRSTHETEHAASNPSRARTTIVVELPAYKINMSDYFVPEMPTDVVERVTAKKHKHGMSVFTIEFEDGTINEDVSEWQVRQYPQGIPALKRFNTSNNEKDQEGQRDRQNDYSSDELSLGKSVKRRRLRYSLLDFVSESQAESETGTRNFRATRQRSSVTRRVLRSKLARPAYTMPSYINEAVSTASESLAPDESDSGPSFASNSRVLHRRHLRTGNMRRNASMELEAPRRSARTTKSQKNMGERLEEDIEEQVTPAKTQPAKAIYMKEVFKPVPPEFEKIHSKKCYSCGDMRSAHGSTSLVFCQGCSAVFHRNCIGYRGNRDHLVTKVGEEDFVFQCRFCVMTTRKKDPLGPKYAMCQGCRQLGSSCQPFSVKRTSYQEERIRLANGGTDPCAQVNPKLLNNTKTLLFRCRQCHRGFHFGCLPPGWAPSGLNPRVKREEELQERLPESSSTWRCLDCTECNDKIDTLVAWRPLDRESYTPQQTFWDFDEDSKEYLVKWREKSYSYCEWRPGAWVYAFISFTMRAGFIRRNDGANLLPQFDIKSAIPSDYVLYDIIFKVEYDDKSDKSGDEDDEDDDDDDDDEDDDDDDDDDNESSSNSWQKDLDRIGLVSKVFVKFQGLGFDDCEWDTPPKRDDEAAWEAFRSAYIEFLHGKHFKSEPQKAILNRVTRFRQAPFKSLNTQPEGLTKGKLMEYQLEGVNWLRFNYHKSLSVILADEMGLGKTIQVIGFVAAMVQQEPHCYPFLVVVPASTCSNWRREFQGWAPNIRCVSYYGGKQPQKLVYDNELFPDNSKDMRAHVVVMSYDSAQNEKTRARFKHVQWAGLVVDEGQRLKSDTTLLYNALLAFKIEFRVLLTGTPLQNNKRELFNLLQFIDPNNDAAALDREFDELTAENIPALHELIRPYFLRRTKFQVLKFLPPMARIIVPVTMTYLQEKLSKSIMAKNPMLIRSILAKDKLKPGERSNLNNMLMQLRKCLCHPFVYSRAVEEKDLDAESLHKNLVEASAKLLLLDIMLPKLKAQGHRVLMFSQFLDNLDVIEDYLNGAGFAYQRLDGSITSQERQKRIDAFNEPGSPDFAFLLSTRAGGVGINLATADTVIILDPDFNPHQDIQALSRAHRIGQQNKVLCIQLVTKNSIEEKIMQIGRKKLALDHALIETMEDKDISGNDLVSVLKHGAEALFSDKEVVRIKYDNAMIEKLLDRSNIESQDQGNSSNESDANNRFSFARVWEQDADGVGGGGDQSDNQHDEVNSDIWKRILEQREQDSLKEMEGKEQILGRGGRRRQAVKYNRVPAQDVAEASDSSDDDYVEPANGPGSEGESDRDVKLNVEPPVADAVVVTGGVSAADAGGSVTLDVTATPEARRQSPAPVDGEPPPSVIVAPVAQPLVGSSIFVNTQDQLPTAVSAALETRNSPAKELEPTGEPKDMAQGPQLQPQLHPPPPMQQPQTLELPNVDDGVTRQSIGPDSAPSHLPITGSRISGIMDTQQANASPNGHAIQKWSSQQSLQQTQPSLHTQQAPQHVSTGPSHPRQFQQSPAHMQLTGQHTGQYFMSLPQLIDNQQIQPSSLNSQPPLRLQQNQLSQGDARLNLLNIQLHHTRFSAHNQNHPQHIQPGQHHLQPTLNYQQYQQQQMPFASHPGQFSKSQYQSQPDTVQTHQRISQAMHHDKRLPQQPHRPSAQPQSWSVLHQGFQLMPHPGQLHPGLPQHLRAEYQMAHSRYSLSHLPPQRPTSVQPQQPQQPQPPISRAQTPPVWPHNSRQENVSLPPQSQDLSCRACGWHHQGRCQILPLGHGTTNCPKCGPLRGSGVACFDCASQEPRQSVSSSSISLLATESVLSCQIPMPFGNVATSQPQVTTALQLLKAAASSGGSSGPAFVSAALESTTMSVTKPLLPTPTTSRLDANVDTSGSGAQPYSHAQTDVPQLQQPPGQQHYKSLQHFQQWETCAEQPRPGQQLQQSQITTNSQPELSQAPLALPLQVADTQPEPAQARQPETLPSLDSKSQLQPNSMSELLPEQEPELIMTEQIDSSLVEPNTTPRPAAPSSTSLAGVPALVLASKPAPAAPCRDDLVPSAGNKKKKSNVFSWSSTSPSTVSNISNALKEVFNKQAELMLLPVCSNPVTLLQEPQQQTPTVNPPARLQSENPLEEADSMDAAMYCTYTSAHAQNEAASGHTRRRLGRKELDLRLQLDRLEGRRRKMLMVNMLKKACHDWGRDDPSSGGGSGSDENEVRCGGRDSDVLDEKRDVERIEAETALLRRQLVGLFYDLRLLEGEEHADDDGRKGEEEEAKEQESKDAGGTGNAEEKGSEGISSKQGEAPASADSGVVN